MSDDINYISQDEFDAIVKALDTRREAIRAAEALVARSKTLAEKIAAKRTLKAAMDLKVPDARRGS